MARTITKSGILVCLALLLSYMENLLPLSPGIPGIKPGLANLVIVSALYFLDVKQVFAISLARVVLTAFFSGSAPAFIFSLSGALASFAAMALCKRSGLFSPLGVSCAGGTAHNLAQLAAAMFMLGTKNVIWLLPYLLLAGIITGCINGLIAEKIISALKNAAGGTKAKISQK